MRLILDDIAAWRPLGNPTEEPSIGIPRLLIWHTMVGYLRRTEELFKKNGFQGNESTFGLGGSWDGPELDGALWQWQRLDRQADAQWDANVFGTSVECSDGGDPDRPFTPLQVEKSIILGVEWCKETGNPAEPAKAWNGKGFGYHSMYNEWNKSRHSCPNPTRIKQLREVIWPEIARRIKSQTGGATVPPPRQGGGVQASVAPKFPLPEGYYFGPEGAGRRAVSGFKSHRADLRRFQQQLKNRGWSLTVDGLFNGEMTKVVRQFQKEKKLGTDGLVGLQTWNAAWTAKIT